MSPSQTNKGANGTATATKSGVKHPFAALDDAEIRQASGLIRALWPAETRLQFKTLTLHEPAKDVVLSSPNQSIERRAWINYYLRNTNKFHEAIVNLTTNKVERNVRLGPNQHGNGDGPEVGAVEALVLKDPQVLEAIAKLQLPEGTVVMCDPWIYGSDGIGDDERMYQCFMYMRDPANPSLEDGNHYAFPLPFSPVVSTETMKVIRVDIMPTGADHTLKELGPWNASRPANEYVPEALKVRTDLKPLRVSQPEGVSFTVEEGPGINTIKWQKWHLDVSFNQREGMVVHNVRYDNRQIFYRVSLSDMNIPYADPRHPYHKKSAFDLGDAGAGIMANNLKLGCDCLGSIHYISATLASDEGEPLHMPNVVCVHEQDAGIGWKHTNFRTGRAAIVRARELVLQSIMTVANYEYIMAFVFNQAAEMHYEVRATGIVSTQAIDDGVDVPFGVRVHPGALAVHHQHIFSLRVDPHIDGSRDNRLVYTEAHPMPLDDFNPHKTGYISQETVVEKSGGYDLVPQHNRTYKVQNAANRNPINGHPVGYKVLAPWFQPILAHPSSLHFKRAEFANHDIYAVGYKEDELYAGGRYTNQSRGGTGVASWAARNDDIKDKDLVLFVQFGMNHIPRVEDFPVMPCEILRVAFKPVNFFDKNPSIDVPPSEQTTNQSVGVNGASEAPPHTVGVVTSHGMTTSGAHCHAQNGGS